MPYNPININGEAIAVDEEAEHVWVIRASNGNMTNIVNRISAFKKAMGAVMACGLARGRRSNPVASLRIITLYGTPVLMSGLASLVMSAKEVSAVDQQLKRAIQNAIKLPNSSPTSLVYFVSGTLPGTAILHLKQLTLFGMVCRLPEDPLHQLACHVLLTSSSPSSWFVVVRNLLMQYQLPHPLLLLNDPPDKASFKKLLKSKILDHWEKKLRLEASLLPSLVYFDPYYMSLAVPHRIWTTAGSNPHEVAKARVPLYVIYSTLVELGVLLCTEKDLKDCASGTSYNNTQ